MKSGDVIAKKGDGIQSKKMMQFVPPVKILLPGYIVLAIPATAMAASWKTTTIMRATRAKQASNAHNSGTLLCSHNLTDISMLLKYVAMTQTPKTIKT